MTLMAGIERSLQKRLRERCTLHGNMAVDSGMSVRAIAEVTGHSKSTVHADITKRLVNVDKELSIKALEAIAYNKSMRAVRGGTATGVRWRAIKMEGSRE